MTRQRGLTMVELLVVLLIFGLLSFAVYRTVWQYFRVYMKTDDKLENVTEAWQVLRLIKEDLAFADFPDGDTSKWRDLIKQGSGSLTIQRRFDADLKPVVYAYDLKKGDLSRTDHTGKSVQVLHQRLRNLSIDVTTRPDAGSLPAGQEPQTVSLLVRLELVNKDAKPDNAVPLVLETNVVPVLANTRFQGRFVAGEFPEAYAAGAGS